MPLYKRPEDTIEEADEQLENQEGNEPQVIVDDSGNWQKRYSDLRSYSTKQVNELKKQINDLQTQVNAKFAPNLPKRKEDVEEWAKKYPDVYGLVKTIIGFDIQDATAEIESKLQTIDARSHENDKEAAINKIVAAHPDFYELESDQAFHEWLSSKSKRIQDAIYENDTDYQAAIEVITMYKLENNLAKKKAGRPPKDAARDVNVPNAPRTPAGARGEYDYSESQIEAMSFREYEAHADAIEEARRNGRLLMDVSGAAR